MDDPSELQFESLLRSELSQYGYTLEGVTWTQNRVKLVSSRARRKRVQLRIARRLLLLGTRSIGPIAGMVAEQRGARTNLQALFQELPQESPVSRKQVLRPNGDAVDLRPLLVFPCSLLDMNPGQIRITWGSRRPLRRRQRTFRLGTYDPRTDIVRLHRILDHTDVPAFYIEYVIYHELVHRHVAQEKGPKAARRHDAHFKKLEAMFPRIEEAREWERNQLMRHARSRRRVLGKT